VLRCKNTDIKLFIFYMVRHIVLHKMVCHVCEVAHHMYYP